MALTTAETDLDQEIKVMRDCLYALLPLDAGARERVMKWVGSKIESIESKEETE